jgi:hypothetical protein
MSDKSPRQSASKKSDKSIKQKRAEKRDKATAATESLADKLHQTRRK